MSRTFDPKRIARGLRCVGLAGVVAVVSGAGLHAQTVVGGLTPAERPQGAPRIERLVRDGAWFRRALAGVSEPVPKSLSFLEDQGDWYTPFNRRGMIGPYDVRRWHAPTR